MCPDRGAVLVYEGKSGKITLRCLIQTGQNPHYCSQKVEKCIKLSRIVFSVEGELVLTFIKRNWLKHYQTT